MHRRIRQHEHHHPRRSRVSRRVLRGGLRLVQTCVAVAAALVAVLAVLALVVSVQPLPLGGLASGLIARHLDNRLAARSLAVEVGALDVSFRAGWCR